MSREYGTMQTNVATDIGDTSTSMKANIARYLNKRYFQVLRATNWQAINDDYTIAVTSAAQDYALPSDYGKEVACVDVTNDIQLERKDLGELYAEYGGDIDTAGTVERYAVWTNDSGSPYIKFHYAPSSSITVAFPYIVKPTELSSSSDTTVIPIEDLLEAGARADAWRYKRQFAKANVEEMQFQTMLAEYIWEQESQPNQVFRFKPSVVDKDSLY